MLCRLLLYTNLVMKIFYTINIEYLEVYELVTVIDTNRD